MKIIIFQLYGEALTYDVDVRGKIIPCGECKTTAVTIGHITGKEGEWSKSYYLILNKTNYNKLEKELFYHGTFAEIGKTFLVRIDNCYIQDFGNLKEISYDEANSILGFNEGQYICKIKQDKANAFHYIKEYLETKDEKLIFDISYIKPIKLESDGIEGIYVTKSTIKRNVFSLDDFFYDLPLQHIKRMFLPWKEYKDDYQSMINNILNYGTSDNL